MSQTARHPVESGLESVFLPERLGHGAGIFAAPEVIFDGRMKAPFQRSLSSPATFAVSGETCGLLLGRKLPGGRQRILVEGYHAVPADASRGGAPYFTPVHERLLNQTFSMYVNHPSVSVLGMYRTCRSGELSLTAEDRDLFHNRFRSPEAIYLLLRPTSLDSSVGALYWLGHEDFAAPTPVEIVGDAGGSPHTTWRRSGFAKERLRWGAQVLLVAGALLVPVAWLAWDSATDSREKAITAAREKADRVQLDIVRVGSDLLISWKPPDSSAISLISGRLTIRDSDYRKEFVLDRQQLASGRLVYQPLTNDVHVTLHANTEDNRLVSDSLRAFYPVVAEKPKSLAEVLQPTLKPQEKLPRESVFELRTQIPRQEEEAETPEGSMDNPGSRNVRQMRLPPSVSPTSAANLSVETPDVGIDLFASVRNPVATPPEAREIIPGWEHRAEERTAAPLVLTQPKLVAASALTTSQPVISAELRKFIKEPLVIPVLAFVNTDGQVESASVETRTTPWESRLAAAARQAAAKWRFRPASIDGRLVSSQVTINFRFTP